MNTFNQAVIISACKKGLDDHINTSRHLELARYAQATLGCPVKHLKGVYKGDIENSLYIEFKNQDNYERLLEFATAMEQESVLLLDSNRAASLIYTDNTGKIEPLGRLRAVTKNGVKGIDCYSYDVSQDLYYITVK